MDSAIRITRDEQCRNCNGTGEVTFNRKIGDRKVPEPASCSVCDGGGIVTIETEIDYTANSGAYPGRTVPGMYLINATGEMTPLATETGYADFRLLEEALDYHGSGTTTTTTTGPGGAEGDSDPPGGTDRTREKVGWLILDTDRLSADEKSALVFALGRDTPFHAEQNSGNRIDVFRMVGDTDESDDEGAV